MKLRRLGRTGLQVSEVGFGTWGISKASWIGADDETSVGALVAARDQGINFFDTALAYGSGHSERLLGRTFGKSQEVIIASKVPPKNKKWPALPGTALSSAYPKDYVFECLDCTLRNLGRETIDIYQFHVWSDEWADSEEWLATVAEIRRSGKARFIGISVNDHQPANVLKALDTGLVDTVQVIYNLFDQSAEDELFPYCQRHDIGVIVRVPFDEGGLTGRIRAGVIFPNGDFRNYYFAGDRPQQVWCRVERLVADCGIKVEQLPALALQFCLSHSAVSTVIPGMRTSTHVADNITAAECGHLSSTMLAKLRGHRWTRNFYSPPVTLADRIKNRIARLINR